MYLLQSFISVVADGSTQPVIDLNVLMPLSAIISVISCVTMVMRFSNERKKDIQSDSEKLIKANVKLDQICDTTTQTQADIKALMTRVNDLANKVAIIENEQKTMWKRIDELKNEYDSINNRD